MNSRCVCCVVWCRLERIKYNNKNILSVSLSESLTNTDHTTQHDHWESDTPLAARNRVACGSMRLLAGVTVFWEITMRSNEMPTKLDATDEEAEGLLENAYTNELY